MSDPIKKYNGIKDKDFKYRGNNVKFTKGSKRINDIVTRIKKHNAKINKKDK